MGFHVTAAFIWELWISCPWFIRQHWRSDTCLRRLKSMLLEFFKCIRKWMPLAIGKNNKVWAENIFLCQIPFMEFCFKWSWWHCSNWLQWIQGILKHMERSRYFPICDTSSLMTSNAVSVSSFWCLSCIGYLYWYSYCKFTCIFLSYDCIFSHCTVYICTLLSYTSLLADVICFP